MLGRLVFYIECKIDLKICVEYNTTSQLCLALFALTHQQTHLPQNADTYFVINVL
jgi:hypothetical protein